VLATNAGLDAPSDAVAEVDGPRNTLAAPTIMFFLVNAIVFVHLLKVVFINAFSILMISQF
jgi:hypothetical protein